MSKSTGEGIFGAIVTAVAAIFGYSYYKKNKKSKK